MHRLSKSESLSRSVSSIIAPQPSLKEDLPLLPCPHCGIAVKKFESHTKDNPNRLFYKCVNKMTQCKFWKWENEYLLYLKKHSASVIACLDSELDGRLQAKLDNLIDEFKKKCEDDERQIKALVASFDKIKLHNIITITMIVVLLIIVVVRI
ncbi:hypothetical protein LUZ62_068725 [Rhynchospora pubera]|uniref:GRF-type domain-containing protein n=1 Tax=Rhynchospora pubera TaxID=906938 RepID=A0AAV8CRY4_9POAL|nr:hypothetical protein LUZ62_068725 [Rhynchospora pubera]